MSNPDGSGDRLDIELLRSTKWMSAARAERGAIIDFALPEMGLQGPARIESVDDCPTLQQGAGRLVLGTVTHLSREVLTIRLKGLAEPLEPTATHPFYSQDRQRWVKAGQLSEGERLRTLSGAVEINSIARKPGVYRVYNLEVQTDHTYLVSNIRVLCHNVGCAADPPGFSDPATGNEMHAKFNDVLPELTNTKPGDWQFNTGPGQTGPDAIYQGPPSRYPGFKYGELKPASGPSFEQFLWQMQNWNLPSGSIGLFFYGPGGAIGDTGCRY